MMLIISINIIIIINHKSYSEKKIHEKKTFESFHF